MGSTAQELSTRAVRFPLHMPVRYRMPSSRKWFEASTENVSRTGVLFRSECNLTPATLVDIRLEVPPTHRDGSHAEVVCQCKVVRTEQAYGGSHSPKVAVAIRKYRFRRKRQAR